MASRADELVRYGEKPEYVPGPETIHEHHNGTMCLWDRAATIIHDLEAENARVTREHEVVKGVLARAHDAHELERQYHFDEVSRLKAERDQALEQRNEARRNQCELEAMVNEPEGFPAERKTWRDKAKRRYAEEAWPGSAAELWPESEETKR